MSLPWLADVLRAAGLTVVEHAGWKTHARPGGWAPRYGVVHATAAPKSQADTVQVRVVRDGRTDLLGPIANAAVDRLGRWHVLSAGRCNSTLTGTAGPYKGLGNTYALSVEGLNDNKAEPWPATQYQSYVRGWAAWCKRLGWTASNLVGHKEHTPGHKTDPTFDMGQFRRDVTAALAGEDADDMAVTDKQWQDAQSVAWSTANRLAALLDNRANAEYQIPGEPKKRVEPNKVRAALDNIAAAVAALAAGDSARAQQIIAEINQVADETVVTLAQRPTSEAVDLLVTSVGEDRAKALWEALGARLNGVAG